MERSLGIQAKQDGQRAKIKQQKYKVVGYKNNWDSKMISERLVKFLQELDQKNNNNHHNQN